MAPEVVGDHSACSGCDRCRPKNSSTFKNFLHELKNANIILNNERVVWDNLLIQVIEVCQTNSKWIQDIDFLSFLEFSLEDDYLLKKGSNISVLGIKLLASLCENEDYFLSAKSHKAFALLNENLDHILKSVYLQSAVFHLIGSLSSHNSGTMWIIEQRMLENFISPALFSSNEFMQQDAAAAVSALWRKSETAEIASDWMIGHFRQLFNENNKKREKPKEGFDVVSIAKATTLILEENYKHDVGSEKLLKLLQTLEINPYDGASSVADEKICHRFALLNVLDEYARLSRDMDNNKLPSGQVDEEDQLLKTFAYAIYRFGVHLSIIEKTIQLYDDLSSLVMEEFSKSSERYNHAFRMLIYIQTIPIVSFIRAIDLEIAHEPLKYFADMMTYNDVRLRKHATAIHIVKFFPESKCMEKFMDYYQQFMSLELRSSACRWVITILTALKNHCHQIPPIAGEVLECLIVEMLFSLHVSLSDAYPDALFESLFELLSALAISFRSELFGLIDDLHEKCVLVVVDIMRSRKHSSKLICSGIKLIVAYFEEKENNPSAQERGSVFYREVFGNLIDSSIWTKGQNVMAGPSTGFPTAKMLESTKELLLLEHEDPEVRAAGLNIILSFERSGLRLYFLLDWMVEHALFENLMTMLADPNSDIVVGAVAILARFMHYRTVGFWFIGKNLASFSLALVADGKSADIRKAGVRLIAVLFKTTSFWYDDLERCFMPAIRMAAEDEDNSVRQEAMEFICDHVSALFNNAEVSLFAKSCLLVPSPQVAVFIWVSQCGYGNAIMKTYYDSCPIVKEYATSSLDVITCNMPAIEMNILARDDFKIYELPAKEFLLSFKAVPFFPTIKKREEYAALLVRYTEVVPDSMKETIVNRLAGIDDLTDLLPCDLSNTEKYKKGALEKNPGQICDETVKAVTVQEFASFLRSHERGGCTKKQNKVRHYFANIDAYIKQLKSAPSIHGGDDPCVADCY